MANVNTQVDDLHCSIRVSDLIAALQKLDPNDFIVVEDEGCNRFCEMYTEPRLLEKMDGITLYTIGRAIEG